MKAMLVCLFPFLIYASSIDRLAYQGRLLQPSGAPIAGPVDLTFRVYLNASATVECSQTISGVALSQGIFNAELTFPAGCTSGTKTISQFMIDAADNSDSVYIEVTDDTNVSTYGKQIFTANTFAMVAKAVVSESVSNTSLLGMSANCANSEIVQTDGLGNFYCGNVNANLVSGIDAVLFADGSVNNTEYQYLDGITSNIQTQLNGKQALDDDLTDLADGSLTATKIGPLSVDNTEFGYLDGVTSAIQTQLNARQATVTGAATTIIGSNLTTNRAVVSNGSGKVAVSAVTSTELGYLDGVTSAVQTQLNAKQASGSYQAADADLTDLADGTLTGSKVGSGISASNVTTGSMSATRIANGTISNTEYQYLNGVTSAIQTQLNSKSATHTHPYQAADADLTDLADGSLTGSKVGSGINSANIANGTVSNTEFQHLNGVTSAIQTQMNDKGVPAGAVMSFNLASCPAGWSELTAARGRVIVGKPSGGTLAGTAGTALSNLENRATGVHNHSAGSGTQSANHSHNVDPAPVTSGTVSSWHTHAITVNAGGAHAHTITPKKGGLGAYLNNVGVGTASANGGTAGTSSAPNHAHSASSGNPSANHSHSVNVGNTTSTGNSVSHSHSVTVNNSSGVAGTNSPYIQLLVCQKN